MNCPETSCNRSYWTIIHTDAIRMDEHPRILFRMSSGCIQTVARLYPTQRFLRLTRSAVSRTGAIYSQDIRLDTTYQAAPDPEHHMIKMVLTRVRLGVQGV